MYLILATGALLVLGATVAVAPVVVALLVPATAAILLLIVLVRHLAPTPAGEIDVRLFRWALGAFALHLAIGLAISHSFAATSYFGGDALQYNDGAIRLAQAWAGHGTLPSLPSGKEGFFYVLGGLYYVFGSHPEVGLVLNAFLAAALVPLTTDITKRLFGAGPSRYAAPLVVLLPGLLIWTSQLLREAGVLFLIVVAIDMALRLSERLTLGAFACLSGTIALLFAFRANVAYVLLGGLVVGLVLSRRRIVTGVGLAAGILTVSLVLVVSVGIGYSGYRTASTADLSTVNTVRLDSSASAASGFGHGRDVSTPSHALSYLPYGLVEFSLGPFPWQLASGRQLLALADVIVLWALLPSIWRGLVFAKRRHRREAAIVLVPAAITACMLALLIANFGTVVRERMQVVILLVPIMAAGLWVRAEERARAEARPPIRPVPMGARMGDH